ncbi:hypothetical protein FOL47_000409, partial [Perkinsus chesapeaki]
MSTFDILLEVLGVKGNGNPWVVEAPFPPKSMLYNPNWYDDWKDLPLGTNIRGFVKAFKLTYMSKDWDAKTCLNWWNSLCEIIVRCSELRTHPALLLLVLIYLLPKPFSVDLRSSVVNAMIAVNSCTLAKDAADKCVLLVWLLHVGKYRQSIKEADEEEKDTWVTHRRMFISAVTSLLNKFMADVSASLALPKEKTIADRIGFYQSLKLTTVINDVTSFQDIFTLEDKLFQELNSSEVINVSVLSMKERFLKLRYILSWPLKRLTDNKKCSTLVPLLNDVKLVSSLLENSKVISEKDFDDFKEKTVALDRYVKSIWPSFFSELKAQSSVPGPVTTSTTMPSLKDKSSSVNASKNENIPDSSVGKNTKEDSSATRAIGDKPATPGKASTSTGIPPGTYCFKCGSKDHWANHCPVRNATEARSSTPSSSSSSSSSTPSPGKGKSTGKSGKGKGKKGSGNYQTKFGRSIRQPDFFTGGTVSTPMAGGNLVSEVPLRMELSQKAFKPYRCIWDSGSEISLIDSDICPYFWRINPIDISGIKPFETDKAAEFIVGFKDSDSPGMIARALLCPPGSLPGDAKVLLGRDFLAESGINLRFHGAANSDNSSKVLDTLAPCNLRRWSSRSISRPGVVRRNEEESPSRDVHHPPSSLKDSISFTKRHHQHYSQHHRSVLSAIGNLKKYDMASDDYINKLVEILLLQVEGESIKVPGAPKYSAKVRALRHGELPDTPEQRWVFEIDYEPIDQHEMEARRAKLEKQGKLDWIVSGSKYDYSVKKTRELDATHRKQMDDEVDGFVNKRGWWVPILAQDAEVNNLPKIITFPLVQGDHKTTKCRLVSDARLINLDLPDSSYIGDDIYRITRQARARFRKGHLARFKDLSKAFYRLRLTKNIVIVCNNQFFLTDRLIFGLRFGPSALMASTNMLKQVVYRAFEIASGRLSPEEGVFSFHLERAPVAPIGFNASMDVYYDDFLIMGESKYVEFADRVLRLAAPYLGMDFPNDKSETIDGEPQRHLGSMWHISDDGMLVINCISPEEPLIDCCRLSKRLAFHHAGLIYDITRCHPVARFYADEIRRWFGKVGDNKKKGDWNRLFDLSVEQRCCYLETMNKALENMCSCKGHGCIGNRKVIVGLGDASVTGYGYILYACESFYRNEIDGIPVMSSPMILESSAYHYPPDSTSSRWHINRKEMQVLTILLQVAHGWVMSLRSEDRKGFDIHLFTDNSSALSWSNNGKCDLNGYNAVAVRNMIGCHDDIKDDLLKYSVSCEVSRISSEANAHADYLSRLSEQVPNFSPITDAQFLSGRVMDYDISDGLASQSVTNGTLLSLPAFGIGCGRRKIGYVPSPSPQPIGLPANTLAEGKVITFQLLDASCYGLSRGVFVTVYVSGNLDGTNGYGPSTSSTLLPGTGTCANIRVLSGNSDDVSDKDGGTDHVLIPKTLAEFVKLSDDEFSQILRLLQKSTPDLIEGVPIKDIIVFLEGISPSAYPYTNYEKTERLATFGSSGGLVRLDNRHLLVLFTPGEPPDKLPLYRAYVPSGLARDFVLFRYHDHPLLAVHLGGELGYQQARLHFYWPGMPRDFRAHVKACISCQKGKNSSWIPNTSSRVTRREPLRFTHVQMDFVKGFKNQSEFFSAGDLLEPNGGWSAFVSIIDRGTKMAMIIPTFGETGQDAVMALLQWSTIFGRPLQVQTDGGPAFISKELEAFLSIFQVAHVLGGAYEPQHQGLVERLHAELRSLVRVHNAAPIGARLSWWVSALLATMNHNQRVNPAYGVSPSLLSFGSEELLGLPDHPDFSDLCKKDVIDALKEHTYLQFLGYKWLREDDAITKEFKALLSRPIRFSPTYHVGDQVWWIRQVGDRLQNAGIRTIEKILNKTLFRLEGIDQPVPVHQLAPVHRSDKSIEFADVSRHLASEVTSPLIADFPGKKDITDLSAGDFVVWSKPTSDDDIP